ncbi:MAG: hypothetical protein AB9866_09480 [Syntrophobacteraceae bacterium]
MILEPNHLFVLGAGFTKAFMPTAPLLVDHYDIGPIFEKFKQFKHAHHILNKEVHTRADGRINIERLMTRLDSGMPYDLFQGAREELLLLLSEIKRVFKQRILEAKRENPLNLELRKALGAFAVYCLVTRSFCITFNYDDILDEVFWQVNKITNSRISRRWDPNTGYGFLCSSAPSASWGASTGVTLPSTSFILKLHGSINWYVRLGYSPPYSIDAIAHMEDWCSAEGVSEEAMQLISLHLESEPFIVPPVLMKSALVEQPIIRLLWEIAYGSLRKAKQVTFIGYSLPLTDIAADFLFREALQPRTEISVVNYASSTQEESNLMDIYHRLFGELPHQHFDFRGGYEWCTDKIVNFVMKDEMMRGMFELYCKRIDSEEGTS